MKCPFKNQFIWTVKDLAEFPLWHTFMLHIKKKWRNRFSSRRRYAYGIKINCHKIFTVRVTRCVNSARRFEYARVKAISNRKIILSKMRRHHRRYYSISFSGISFDDEEAREWKKMAKKETKMVTGTRSKRFYDWATAAGSCNSVIMYYIRVISIDLRSIITDL